MTEKMTPEKATKVLQETAAAREKEFKGKMGSGRGTIDMETSNGSIFIESSS